LKRPTIDSYGGGAFFGIVSPATESSGLAPKRCVPDTGSDLFEKLVVAAPIRILSLERCLSMNRPWRVALEVRESFLHGCFNRLAAALYLAHQHGALHRGDAEISHTFGVRRLAEVSLRSL